MRFYNSDLAGLKDMGFEPYDTIDFDPTKYTTKQSAATALYKALQKKAEGYGQAVSEVILQTPVESAACGTGKNWRVIWEAGPYQWAVSASMNCANMPYWYTEPYYSFDLCFTE